MQTQCGAHRARTLDVNHPGITGVLEEFWPVHGRGLDVEINLRVGGTGYLLRAAHCGIVKNDRVD